MASQKPDIEGTVADLRRLVAGSPAPGLMTHVMQMLRGLV